MIKKAVLSAQKKLLNDPYDIYHDISHHSNVWGQCLLITHYEKLSPNFEPLEIAAWWHDIYRDNDYLKLLGKDLRKIGLNPKLLKDSVKIVSEHSFGKNQTSLEAKILYDADKIELLSIPRFEKAMLAYKQGLISIEEREKYTKRWNEILPQLEKTLNYRYTVRVIQRGKKMFTKWLKSIGRNDNGLWTIIK